MSTAQSELVIRFSNPSELQAQLSALSTAMSGGKGPAAAVAAAPNAPDPKPAGGAVLSEAEAARIAGSAATVSMPKEDGRSAAAKKAKAEAAAKAAQEAKEAEEAALASTGELSDDEALGDDDVLGETEAESFTKEDVTKMLLELKAAVPSDPSIVAKVVKEEAKVQRLGDVTADLYPKIVARVRAEMKKVGK